MKKKIFRYFNNNSTEANKAVVNGLLDEIIASAEHGAAVEAYAEGHSVGYDEGRDSGYDSAYQEVAANENLKPENIKKGVDLFGVIGTYEGEPIEE